MHFVSATMRKDVARWWRDRNAFLIWLAIPLLIGGLLTSLTSSDSGPAGTLLIDDQDDTLVSGVVAGAFTSEQMAEMFIVEQVSAAEGNERIAAGEASGFLTIPEGFQAALLNDTPVTLTLKTNPSQTILPGIIQNVTEVVLDAGFYLQAVFSDEIEQIRGFDDDDLSPSDLMVSDVAVDINAKMQTLGPNFDQPAFDLEIVAPPPEEPQPDIGLLFVPGIILMALLFTAQGLSGDFWVERECGALRRLVSSPGPLLQFVMGKALAAALVIGFITGITTVLSFAYHGIGWSKLPPTILFAVAGGVAFFAWFAALQMLFSTRNGANLLTSIVLFPLLMIGGSFFPLDTLPEWLADIGRLAPNGFIVEKMTIELTSPESWTYSVRSWLIVIAMLLSGLMLCSWRLQAGFARR